MGLATRMQVAQSTARDFVRGRIERGVR